MTSSETDTNTSIGGGDVTLPRAEYEALLDRNAELEDALAAVEADDGSRVPHEAALAMIRGDNPVLAFRNHLGLTLRELSARTGIAASYLSEIERGLKPGSASALARLAEAFGSTIDALVGGRTRGGGQLQVAEEEPEYRVR